MLRSHLKILGLSAALVVATACATPRLTPLQERAYSAFKDCQSVAPTAQITELREDGGFGYSAAPGDYQRMQRCLEERYGYTFK
jgi:hypothetical protein